MEQAARANCHRYTKEISEGTNLKHPVSLSFTDPVWHLFVVRCTDRGRLQSILKDSGVSTLIHYPSPPPHLSPAYREGFLSNLTFETTEALAHTVLSLPIGPTCGRKSQVSHVISSVNSALATM